MSRVKTKMIAFFLFLVTRIMTSFFFLMSLTLFDVPTTPVTTGTIRENVALFFSRIVTIYIYIYHTHFCFRFVRNLLLFFSSWTAVRCRKDTKSEEAFSLVIFPTTPLPLYKPYCIPDQNAWLGGKRY